MRVIRLVIVMLLALAAPAAGQHIEKGQEAPRFSLKTPGNRMVRSDDYQGRVVLLNFWATWCAPCSAEMPDLVKWQNAYRSQGLRIIGITLPAYKKGNVLKLTNRLRINYPVLLDNEKVAERYGVGEVLPVTIVIDRQGRIVDRILGIIDVEEFEKKVKPLLE